ncbi:MAG: sensor histidine kinase [Planctomycetota bacterium]
MFGRRSLKFPITLGVLMIVSVIALTVGWVLLSAFGASADSGWAPLYWTLLSVGSIFFAFMLVGIVMYLTLSVQAINLNRRQSNFIDSVTHELKSPLTSLKLYLQTLGRRRVSERERADFVRFMLDDVERLDVLINHLLDAARLELPVEEEDVEDIDVARNLRHCVEVVCARYRLPINIVKLNVEPCIVRARAVDLDLVFRNLIDNAVKYASDEPQVEVSATREGEDQCIIRISDNGKGIPPALRRKIFGRFFRRGDELEREAKGLGLGLYIVRNLVRRLRGQIHVRDRAEGPGTTFEVALPITSP